MKYNKTIITTSTLIIGIVLALYLSKDTLILKYNTDVNTDVDVTKAVSRVRGDNATISTTTPSGVKAIISFTPCDSADFVSCFGSGRADPIEIGGQIMYDLVSTAETISFGMVSRTNNNLPYVIDIDLGKNIYTMSDYDYFKKSVPTLMRYNKVYK